MPRLPATLARSFTVSVSVTRRKEVGRWWASLPAREKRKLRKGSSDELGRLPVVTVPLLAHFVEPRSQQTATEYPIDLYEWIVGHELEFFQPRMIHICSAHVAARTALDERVLPSDFACPLLDRTCPMRALLAMAPGRDVVFAPGLVRSRRSQ